MIASIYFSLTDYNVLQPPNWVGLDNYKQILGSDELFRTALLNTVYYTVLYVPLHIIVALGLALLLTRRVRGVPFWRTFFYIPSITPVVAVAILWRWILNPDGGALNQALAFVGIHGPGWTTDPAWMKGSLVLMALWSVGSTMLIYIAGIKNVPQELYEAAKVDGAGALTRFFRITLPMLSGVLFFTAVIGVIAALQLFAQPAVLFEPQGGNSNGTITGGAGNAALFYIMYLFNQAFAYFKMGYASALAWILFVIIVAFTILQFRLSNRWVYYEGGEA
jgi:multiple sugar transport system permease protein